MAGRRIARVEQLLKRELSDIIQHSLKDPRIGFVTVTMIKVSPDLRHAKIYASVMGDEEAKERTMGVLKSAAGFIQRELGKRVNLKFLPHCEFLLDESTDYGFHIMEILEKLKEEKKDD